MVTLAAAWRQCSVSVGSSAAAAVCHQRGGGGQQRGGNVPPLQECMEKGEPLHLVCFKLGRICFSTWGWLEWKFNKRKRIYIFRRSTWRYRSHIGINTFSHQIHLWCGLQRILVIIILLLSVCSHHHCWHHAVATQHSFLGETMTSINKKMIDTPTKKKNGKLVSKAEKKNGLRPKS